jgi:hypothetical protein
MSKSQMAAALFEQQRAQKAQAPSTSSTDDTEYGGGAADSGGTGEGVDGGAAAHASEQNETHEPAQPQQQEVSSVLPHSILSNGCSKVSHHPPFSQSPSHCLFPFPFLIPNPFPSCSTTQIGRPLGTRRTRPTTITTQSQGSPSGSHHMALTRRRSSSSRRTRKHCQTSLPESSREM